MFKEFRALVENQTGKKIKVLTIDNGEEFCRKEFEEFCKKCGIARRRLLHIHLSKMESQKE